MFGYVRPFEPELRVKELDAYKAVYCGLCGQLGRSFGPVARLTLSYDFAFLAMLHGAVNGGTPAPLRRRCYVNPLKKVPVCTGGEALELGADIAAIMLYYKLLDNIQDGGFFAKVGWSCLRPAAGQARKKAAARRPAQEAVIAEGIARQSRVERDATESLDAASEPTAALMGGLFRLLTEREREQRVLERLGYLIGRYVYVCDALDDLEKDLRSGGYNPIALRYRLTREGGGRETARQGAVESLYMTIGEAEKTLALLELHDFAPIIRNVVAMGLRARVSEICSKKEKAT